MLYVKSPILNFFQLVLRVFLDSTLDTINKNHKVLKLFFQKRLKLNPRDKIYSFFLMPKFMLMPMEVDWFTKKKSCKQNIVGVGSTDSLEIVLKLLAKLVTIHVGFLTIQVKKTSFKRPPSRSFVGSAMFLSIHEDFHELVKVCISVLGWCGYENRRRHNCIRGDKNGIIKVGKRKSS